MRIPAFIRVRAFVGIIPKEGGLESAIAAAGTSTMFADCGRSASCFYGLMLHMLKLTEVNLPRNLIVPSPSGRWHRSRAMIRTADSCAHSTRI